MSLVRSHWPDTLRPVVAYRPPPTRQPTRSATPRDVCADVSHFLERAAKPYARTGKFVLIIAQRWSTESASEKHATLNGEWPSECTPADFDDALRLAQSDFGEPRHRTSERNLESQGLELEWYWRVPVDRVDEVLDFLDSVPSCTGGEFAPVRASYSCLFWLRDLDTRSVLPKQGTRYHPLQSTLSVDLQRSCRGSLALTLPFDEPTDMVANYVVALQRHAPVWLDPRYFDHIVPAPDRSRLQFTRLPPSWIGVTPAGDLRLDASRSGITPMELDLPTDAEMAAEDATLDDANRQRTYATIVTALRERSLATLLIRGADEAEYMLEHAANWLEMSLRVVRTVRVSRSLSIEEELRTVISGLDGRQTVLLLEIVPYAEPETNAALLSQMAGRVLMGVELPPDVRLVVSVEVAPSEDARAAAERYDAANTEGFGTKAQLEFLGRQASRAGWREVAIEVLPLPMA